MMADVPLFRLGLIFVNEQRQTTYKEKGSEKKDTANKVVHFIHSFIGFTLSYYS